MTRRISLLVALALFGCKSAEVSQHHSPVSTTRSAASKPASLQTRLDEILNRLASTGAIVSARVVDPETGKEIFAQDASRPMTPASNMKLTVDTAALDFFGADAEFSTDLVIVGNDLWLVGHGDPATGDAEIAKKYKIAPTAFMDAWADQLIASGHRSFSGNLYYVDNAFEKQQTHPTWDNDELGEWYAAPIAGLNLNDNCIDATAEPAKTNGEPPKLDVEPVTSQSVTVINHATTDLTKKKKEEQTIDWTRAVGQNVYTVEGVVGVVTELQSKPVTDPGAFFADALRTRLAAKGISIAGATTRGDALPTGATTALKPAVTKFTDVLWRINKNSQNLLAEGTAKKLGLEYAKRQHSGEPAVGSWKNADEAIRAFWQANKIDATGYHLADGSGLSTENKLTTRLLSDILVTVYHKPYFKTFLNSMTIGGVDGTTKKRFTDAPGRVFCKTGYISGVRSLTGYVRTDSGKYRVFSIIFNKIPGRGIAATKKFEDAQDDAVRALMAD